MSEILKEEIANETDLPKSITIGEIISDDFFIESVKQNIGELIKSRRNRPEPKQGFRYKRDWYDRMREDGQLNSQFFISNIADIWTKQSSLSSQVRTAIQLVCDKSLHQTLSKYQTK